MSIVKVTLPPGEIPVEGKQVSFKAPCPCSEVEAIQIDGVNYTICDALGECVTGSGGVWDVGSVVRDSERGTAESIYSEQCETQSCVRQLCGYRYLRRSKSQYTDFQLPAEGHHVLWESKSLSEHIFGLSTCDAL